MVYSLAGMSILLHGVPKIGKTTLAASFPNPMFFATHRGHGFLPQPIRKRVVYLKPGADGWREFKTRCEQVGDFKGVHTVVVDFISDLYRMCRMHVCEKNSWRHTTDGAHGRGWDAVKDELIYGMQLLGSVAGDKKIIMFIDQTKHTELKTELETLDKVECAMTGHCRGVVEPICNHIWYLGYAGSNEDPMALMHDTTESQDGVLPGQRTLWLQGTNLIHAGTQDPYLVNRSVPELNRTGQYKQVMSYLAHRPTTKTK